MVKMLMLKAISIERQELRDCIVENLLSCVAVRSTTG